MHSRFFRGTLYSPTNHGELLLVRKPASRLLPLGADLAGALDSLLSECLPIEGYGQIRTGHKAALEHSAACQISAASYLKPKALRRTTVVEEVEIADETVVDG